MCGMNRVCVGDVERGEIIRSLLMALVYQILDNPSEFGVKSDVKVVKIEKSGVCVKKKCVIHYGGEYERYSMKVNEVNEKREGEALILINDQLRMKLEYVNDVLNGVMEMYNKGVMVVRGNLLKGKESGLFEEYVDSFVVWQGYYHEGNRYSVVRKSDRVRGFYEERSVESGRLLSVAEYDRDMRTQEWSLF